MQLSDYAQALGAAQQLVPNWRQGDMQEAQLATARMQPQLIQAQIGQAQARAQQESQKAAYDQQRRAQFQTTLQTLGARPSAKALYEASTQFPEFANALQGAAKGIGAEDATKLVRNLAPVQSLIQNGKYDLAANEVKRHIDADKAAGIEPDEHDTELYGMLTSGDPAQAKAAGGMVFGLLSALNPETAAKNLADAGQIGGRKGQVVGRTIGHYDDSGKWVSDYRDPDPQANALEVPIYDGEGKRIGTQLVANGGKGGDPASSGGAAGGSPAAPAGRTIGGWTPRARNGGDNPDAAVDGKISGMSSALGIDPSAPFPPGTTNLQIAQALTLSEGGKGSIADRNNNPGNLTDPKTGGYRKFATKEAGLQAAAAQVARNRARGQNTIQTMVEGLPAGGSAAARGQPGYFGPQGGAGGGDDSTTGDAFLATLPAGRRNLLKNISEGRAAPPKPGSKFGEKLAEDLARAYPDADTTTFATRQQAMKSFSSGPQGNTVRSLNVAIDHLGVLHDAALALHNGNTPLFNKLSQRFQKETGSPLPSNAKAIAGIVGDEVTKAVVGSAGALADREDIKSTLNTAGSPAQIMGITRSYISLMAGQAKGLQRQYEQATGNKDFSRFLNNTTAKQLGLSKTAPPKPGMVVRGYRFKGGNPADRSSWVKQ